MEPSDSLRPDSLRLPDVSEIGSFRSAVDLDEALAAPGRGRELDAALTAVRDQHVAMHLMNGRLRLDEPSRFLWPSSLFIPAQADPFTFWFTQAPDDHRYSMAWTFPAGSANTASIDDGTLVAFAQLRNDDAGSSLFTESGVGVFHEPSISLGVVEMTPHVDCSGSLRTLMNLFQQPAAGFVEVKVSLLLAAWHQIPNGFDLVGYKSVEVATSGHRDQSFGPENRPFLRSFNGPELSARFVVQRGRRYLMGVVTRVTVLSALTATSAGLPLPTYSSDVLRVWGSAVAVVRSISVANQRVDIP